jgi:hypothetical protein
MSAMNDAPGKSALDTTISLTYFTDHTGIYATPDRTTLRALIPKLTNTTAASKAALPWTKLAQFGQQRTEKSSLRHNANVLAIHGVEADYDGEQITLDSARRIMAGAGLAAILYTSPSHTASKPRWRILCPTSVPYPPAERSRFLARVNGLFAGALSAESFTLSQSYYYGRVGDAPDHEVVAVDGGHIDHADHLDAQAVGRPGKEHAPHVPAAPSAAILGQPTGCTKYGMVALEGECNAIRMAGDGMKHHAVNKSAYSVGGLVSSGQLIQSIAWAALTDALSTIAGQCKDFPAAQKTLEQAFAAGIGAPRNVPDRGRPNLIVVEHHPPAEIDDDGYRASLDRSAIEHGEDHGPDVEFQDFVERVEPVISAGRAPTALPVIYFNDIKANLDVADFVEGLLIDASMSVVYGQSNSGKTFFVLDLALHVATGKPWNGRAVEQRGVLWLAMEGAYGAMNRVVAWCREHEVDAETIPFAIIPVALDLLNEGGDIEPLLATMKVVAEQFSIPVGMTVVDTLARAMAGGNENAPDDMGRIVKSSTRIQQENGSAILWIHHAGKDDAKGARGHSSLRAATDTEIEVVADGANRVTTVRKQRELECVGEFAFTLKVVELGTNKRGKPVTSCVVEGSSEGHTADAVLSLRLKGHNRRALDVLHDLLAESGKAGFPGVPTGYNSIPEEWWRRRFYDRTLDSGKDDASQNAKRMAFNRASSELVDKRLVGVVKGRVWAIRGGSEGGE